MVDVLVVVVVGWVVVRRPQRRSLTLSSARSLSSCAPTSQQTVRGSAKSRPAAY